MRPASVGRPKTAADTCFDLFFVHATFSMSDNDQILSGVV